MSEVPFLEDEPKETFVVLYRGRVSMYPDPYSKGLDEGLGSPASSLVGRTLDTGRGEAVGRWGIPPVAGSPWTVPGSSPVQCPTYTLQDPEDGWSDPGSFDDRTPTGTTRSCTCRPLGYPCPDHTHYMATSGRLFVGSLFDAHTSTSVWRVDVGGP